MPAIRYYANREIELTPLIAGSLPQAVTDPPLIVGVEIDGHIHLICVKIITHFRCQIFYFRKVGNMLIYGFNVRYRKRTMIYAYL